jgi:GNAT superfamily N-acetyltransferase
MVPAATSPPFPCRVPFRLDLAREEDIPHLATLRPGFYTVAQLQARLREGHLGFVGRCGDEIAHQRWLYVNAVYLPYLFRQLVLAPGEGYLDEVYTAPRWRGAGVETAAAHAMQRILHAMGYRRVICSIATWNLTPRRVAERQGYARVGVAGYWALPGFRKFFWEGIRDDRSRNEITILP